MGLLQQSALILNRKSEFRQDQESQTKLWYVIIVHLNSDEIEILVLDN